MEVNVFLKVCANYLRLQLSLLPYILEYRHILCRRHCLIRINLVTTPTWYNSQPFQTYWLDRTYSYIQAHPQSKTPHLKLLHHIPAYANMAWTEMWSKSWKCTIHRSLLCDLSLHMQYDKYWYQVSHGWHWRTGSSTNSFPLTIYKHLTGLLNQHIICSIQS